MTLDPNTRRLLDKIDLLERANAQQLATITTYRNRNVTLERENRALRNIVGKSGIQAPLAPRIKTDGMI